MKRITNVQGRVLTGMQDGYELGISHSVLLPRTAWLTKKGEISVQVQIVTVDCLVSRKLIRRVRCFKIGIATHRTVYGLTTEGRKVRHETDAHRGLAL